MKMKITKTLLTILIITALLIPQQPGSMESIQQWSQLLGKMQKNISQDLDEQDSFNINVASLEREISQLADKMNDTRDKYVKDELQAEYYSMQAELCIGKIIRMERKLELATVVTEMLESLTHILLNSTGGSRMQQKYNAIIEQQRQYKAGLKRTNEILADLIGYFPVTTKGVIAINKYRNATQHKVQKEKVYKDKAIAYYEKQFDILEEMEIKVLEGYDPLEVELDILGIEMDLEMIMLDAALHNIEVQGDFITEMISVNPVR